MEPRWHIDRVCDGAPGPVRLWRLWVDARRAAERIEIAGESVEYPGNRRGARPAGVFTIRRGTRISIASTPVSRSKRSRPSSSFETDPHFSPDGRRLAFVSGRSGHVQIWVAAADGSNARQLTHNMRQWPGSPSWSPDGRSIAFDSGDVGEQVRIWTIDADGGTPRQITSGPGNQSVPRWSRDGKWIYFSSDRASTRNIWRVPATGGEPQQVTRTGSGFVGYEFGGGTSLLTSRLTETRHCC